MENNILKVLIVGANGKIGSLITKQCLLQNNLEVDIFIRSRKKCEELAKEVDKAGGKVIEGDCTNKEDLKDITK